MFWSTTAWAQTTAAAQPSMVEQMLPFIAIFAIFYFFIIRPQSKRQKQHVEFLTNMKRGDEVITNGGIFGRIEGITETFITLEVSDGVKIRILKTQVSAPAKDTTAAKTK